MLAQSGDAESERAAIEGVIRVWFEALSTGYESSRDLEGLRVESPTGIVLFGETISSNAELQRWISATHEAYPSVHYHVESVRVEFDEADTYRATIDVTRHARDRDELLYIARKEQVWRVAKTAGSPLALQWLSGTERMRVPFPTTGSKVMCL